MISSRNISWTLRRYVFRRDVLKKVRSRYESYRRRAERDAFRDVAYAYTGRVGDPRVIFDVGANIGLVTSQLLRLFPAASVHAFEPTEETGRVLRSRLSDERRLTSMISQSLIALDRRRSTSIIGHMGAVQTPYWSTRHISQREHGLTAMHRSRFRQPPLTLMRLTTGSFTSIYSSLISRALSCSHFKGHVGCYQLKRSISS